MVRTGRRAEWWALALGARDARHGWDRAFEQQLRTGAVLVIHPKTPVSVDGDFSPEPGQAPNPLTSWRTLIGCSASDPGHREHQPKRDTTSGSNGSTQETPPAGGSANSIPPEAWITVGPLPARGHPCSRTALDNMD